MRIVHAAEHRVMPWKNGGGFTTEIAVFPPGADLENFGWRISTAQVTEDGPFSRFENIDRTLSVLTGAGIVLHVAERAPVTLTPETSPVSFPGDAETRARLLGGPIADLNVMTRRGAFTHCVARFDGTAVQRLLPTAQVTLLLSRGADIMLADPGGTARLDTEDAAFLAGPTEITPNGAPFLLVEIFGG